MTVGYLIITARIRSMREGNSFSLFVCLPTPRNEHPLRAGWGYPPLPSQDGVRLILGWGTYHLPPPPLQPRQQREYLLCGGRYASCVHAGGLSCSLRCTVSDYMGLESTRPSVVATSFMSGYFIKINKYSLRGRA